MNKRIFFATILILMTVNLSIQAFSSEQESNPFGVLEFLHWNHSWNNFKYPDQATLKKSVSLMKEAGVGIVRMDFLWQDIEPVEGQFNFKNYDNIVDLLNSNDIQILGILNYTSDWASSCGMWNCPPEENALFVNYAAKVIEHFKGRVKFWEVWNEPDSHIYWSRQDGLKGYCSLLKDVYIAAKQVNPDCKILNGGFAKGVSSVNKLYENGAKNYFDILNIHIFDTPLSEGAMKRVSAYPKAAYKIMKRNGDGDKKIWITEIGCPGIPVYERNGTTDKIDFSDWQMDGHSDEKWVKKSLDKLIKTEKERGSREIKTGNWWLGENPDEKQQAEWVGKAFNELIKNENIEKIFWAFFRDCNEHWKNGTDYLGLVCWNFSRKPAFYAYKKCFENWKNTVR